MQNTLDLIIDKTQPSKAWPVYFISAAVGIIPLIVIFDSLFKG